MGAVTEVDQTECMTSLPGTWWPIQRSVEPGRVAVLTVSHNTKALTALLLWSLYRALEWPTLEVVVVDNRSHDGSAELLAEIHEAGLCTLIANEQNICTTARGSTRGSRG